MSVSPSGPRFGTHSSGRQGSRTLISPRENRVSTAARPTVSGYLPIKSVDPPGIEPGSPACRAGVVPLDHEPAVIVDRPGNRTPISWLQGQVSSRWTSQPIESRGPSGNRTRSPSLPRTCAAATPTDRLSSVIPAGIEPALSCMSRRRLRRWTTGSLFSDQGGSRTHRHEALDLAAMPICVPGRGGSGSCTGHRGSGVSRLMRPGRAYAHAQVAGPGIEPGTPAL